MSVASDYLYEKIRRIWLAAGQSESDLARLQKAGGTTLQGLAEVATDQSLNCSVRSAAVWVLGRISKLGRLRKADALHPLLVALADPDKWLRGDAALALGVLDDSRARDQLIAAMRTDPEPKVRQLAAHALGDLRGAKAVDALRGALANQVEDSNVRGEAAEALGYCFAREAIPDLVKALRDESAEVRFWAAFALGFMKVKAALVELERLTQDDAEVPGWWSIAKEAAWAIGEIRRGDPEA